MKHTPGPWKAISWRNSDALGKPQWKITNQERAEAAFIANVYTDLPREFSVKSPDACLDEAEANARLIAAAPELLEALQTIANLIDAPHFNVDRKYRIRNLAADAIAKATGETK